MKNNDSHPIGHEQVKKQLERILLSERFGNSQLLSMFLRFIVEETLAGRVNAIKEYTIAITVLGRPADFNPQVDAVVRIHAGRLRRLLSEYYRTDGIDDELCIEIPKGSYVPIFKPYVKEVITETASTNGHDRIVNSTAVVQPISHRKVGLVVFPFQNLSGDHANDHFVESTGEQLSLDFAKFSQISVISYHSMNKVTIEKRDISDIHKVYDVDYILTGSIRFSKKIVQINIQFVCAETGTLAWTQTFIHPHTASNLYAIQDSVVERVVNRIADIDGLITMNVTNGPLAPKKDIFGIYYAAYQYFGFRTKYDLESYKQARASLEKAIISDPTNALIWSLLANLFLNNHIFQFEPSDNDIERTRDYAERALWLDPNCQYAYEAMSWVYLLTGKKNECIEMIERCIDLNPRALSVVGNMGFLLLCLGKTQQGFHLFLRSMHLTLSTIWYVGVGFALYYYSNGDYQEAVNWIDRGAIPEFPLKSVIKCAANKQLKKALNNEGPKTKTEKPIEEAVAILDQFIYDGHLKESLLAGLAL